MTSVVIPVEFSGDGSGEDDLSWGQREIWQALVDMKTWMPIGGTAPLPPGHTVEDSVERLRYFMQRFQPLRTRLRFEPDGTARQVVHERGTIGLEVVDAGADDPLETGRAVQRRLMDTDLDFEHEWPFRMAVIVKDGAPSHLVAIMSHLVTDAAGAGVMIDEGERGVATPVDGLQPLGQAQWQRSPSGQRVSTAALRHWEGLLRTIPLQRYTLQPDPRLPRYWRGELTSPALEQAVRGIVHRTGADSTATHLALYAVAMHKVGGVDPVATRVISSNRFRPGLARVVGPVSQTALCSLEVGGQPFEEVLARARRASMLAMKHSYYDHDALQALIATVARERGGEIDLNCFFNDRRAAVAGEPVERAAAQAARARTELRWTLLRDEPYLPLFLNFDDDAPGVVRLHIEIDTHHVPPAAAEALLFGIEEAAIAAL